MGSCSTVIRLALGAIGLTVAFEATQVRAAHSAAIFNEDHDPLLTPFAGTIHGDGYYYEPGFPILTPGISFLNGISGGSNNSATGNLLVTDPSQGQVGTTEFVALAINVMTGTIGIHDQHYAGPLLGSGAADDIVADLNSSEFGGLLPTTAFAYDNIPSQYLPEADYLSAGEAAAGGQPFDILEVGTFTTPPDPGFGPNLYWMFDFSQEVGNLDSIRSLAITDIGVVPEPTAALLAFVGLSLVSSRRHNRPGS